MTLLEKCGKKYHQCIIEVSSYYGRTTKGVIVVRRADALNLLLVNIYGVSL
jgi:hypothetical protein